MAVEICQCGAWQEKMPDLEEYNIFYPRDKIYVLREEYETFDEEEMTGGGSESRKRENISPFSAGSKGS